MQIAAMSQATDLETMRIATSQSDTKRAAGNLRAARNASPEQIDAVAEQFEAQFIGQMLQNMFSTVDTKGFLGGGEAEETYRGMIINEYGKLISRAGGIGVADHVKREMLSMQEVANAPA